MSKSISYFAIEMDAKYYKKYYDKLNTHFQLLTALSILCFIPVWMYVESKSNGEEVVFISESIQLKIGLFSVLLTLILVGLWHYQYHRSLKSINVKEALLNRLNYYKRYFLTLIIKMTALSILISIVYFFIQADAMIAAYAILLVLISMNRLTFQRVARQLKMKGEEKAIFFGEK
ncbi:hypothetical protein HZR84_12855 [Hyphobacterium sp. CCMP332]|nr:hypothetical protein HZR84_12855 [Hyphobacterium sp. CCMP332]